MSELEASVRELAPVQKKQSLPKIEQGADSSSVIVSRSKIIRGKKTSRIWFEIHSWVGFKLSLFMSFILITGTLAALSNEMDWLTHASMRVTPQSESAKASWGDIYQSLKNTYPDWQFSYIREPDDRWFTVLAYGHTPEGRTRLVDVNPYTAEVQGDRHWLSFQRFFRNSHRHLMLPTKIGVPMVSALAILLLISLVSGLVVYKKFWRGFFKKPRVNRGRRVFHGDLHRLMSLWSIWFVLIIALTGLFYLAESLGWRAPPFGKINPAQAIESKLDGASIDRYAARAKEILPGFRIALVLPPQKAGDNLIFQGYTDGTWLVRARASYVAFDPATGEVLGSHRSANANLQQRISEMADPLHFGYFGGLPIKLVWFVFGALMSALAITGVVIYATRIQKSILQPANAAAISWTHMGVWKWVGVAGIVVVILLTPSTASGLGFQ